MRRSARAVILGVVLGALLALPAPAGAVTPLPADWQRGAVVPGYTDEAYLQSSTRKALEDLRATGTSHVQLFFHWYMEGRYSSRVAPSRRRTPTDESILHAVSVARSLGMSVSLNPVARPYESWQGNIRPRDMDRWFRSYRAMIEHYARLGEQAGVEMLLVGAEFRTIQHRTRQWRRVIEVARRHFSGALTYGANAIDGARDVQFWDTLDYISMSAYLPLSSRDPNPTIAKLVRAWTARGYVAAIRDLFRRYDRPVLFTELGYQSRRGTAIAPWADGTGAISQTPQRRAYEAAYRVWSRYDWFAGLYWWRWMPGAYSPGDGTHSPRGKDAEDVMTAWSTAD